MIQKSVDILFFKKKKINRLHSANWEPEFVLEIIWGSMVLSRRLPNSVAQKLYLFLRISKFSTYNVQHMVHRSRPEAIYPAVFAVVGTQRNVDTTIIDFNVPRGKRRCHSHRQLTFFVHLTSSRQHVFYSLLTHYYLDIFHTRQSNHRQNWQAPQTQPRHFNVRLPTKPSFVELVA